MTLLSRDTTRFLTQLRANNDRQWFEAHRADYEVHVKRPGEAFARALANELEAAMGEPHEYRIFRVHRDVRLSKDKTPYNAHLHISFSPDGGCKDGGPAWMFGLDPDGLTLGTGIFALSASRLKRWRALVAAPEGASVAALIDRLRAEEVRFPGVDENENFEFAIPLRRNTPQVLKVRKRDRDRAERLRLAGGPKPSLRDRAVALATERGEVRTRDLADIGVPRSNLARMCQEGLLVKVGYDLYRTADREAA